MIDLLNEHAPTIDEPWRSVSAEQRSRTDGRPWVYANMVSSIDGATVSEGVSGPLSSPGDRAVFRGLRAAADIIVAGANTVRAEAYRPPPVSEEIRQQRRERGQSERPLIAVITRTLSFPDDLPLLQDPTYRPLILAPAGAIERLGTDEPDIHRRLADRAELCPMADPAGPQQWIDRLAQTGANRVLCEGGPTINGALVAAGLFDEWNLTIAPRCEAGTSDRVAVGRLPEGPPPAMRLARVWSEDDYLFCRWIRAGS